MGFPLGIAPAPPGETSPDRLAGPPQRQAPTLSQTHCFIVTACGAHHVVRRHMVQGPLTLVLSPSAHTRAARRYTSSIPNV